MTPLHKIEFVQILETFNAIFCINENIVASVLTHALYYIEHAFVIELALFYYFTKYNFNITE